MLSNPMSWEGIDKLYHIEGIMDRYVYGDILR